MHIQKHRLTQGLLLVPRRARVRAVGERRFPLACIHAHVPMARSGADKPQGGTPASPTLIGSDQEIDLQRQQRRQQPHHQQHVFVLYLYILFRYQRYLVYCSTILR